MTCGRWQSCTLIPHVPLARQCSPSLNQHNHAHHALFALLCSFQHLHPALAGTHYLRTSQENELIRDAGIRDQQRRAEAKRARGRSTSPGAQGEGQHRHRRSRPSSASASLGAVGPGQRSMAELQRVSLLVQTCLRLSCRLYTVLWTAHNSLCVSFLPLQSFSSWQRSPIACKDCPHAAC